MEAILDVGQGHQSQFWKRAIQGVSLRPSDSLEEDKN